MTSRPVQRLAAELTRTATSQGVPSCWMEPGVIFSVTPGAASDGNDLVTVIYRDTPAQAAYLSTYTPTVGHRVCLLVQSSGSVLILARIIGTP